MDWAGWEPNPHHPVPAQPSWPALLVGLPPRCSLTFTSFPFFKHLPRFSLWMWWVFLNCCPWHSVSRRWGTSWGGSQGRDGEAVLAEAAEGASSSSPCLGKGDGCCTSWCWEHRGDVGGLLVTSVPALKCEHVGDFQKTLLLEERGLDRCFL